MMNKTGIALEDRFNCQGLHVDVGLHESCELGRNASNANRLNAVLVDQAGNLNAATGEHYLQMRSLFATLP